MAKTVQSQAADALRPSLLLELLKAMIPARLPILIASAPGLGKTELVEQAARFLKYDLMVSHPVVADPTDAKGLPWIAADKKSAHFLPFGDLQRALDAPKPLIWFLDDLGQATPAVQASFMQLILGRAINGHALPEHVTFVAATNRRSDRAGVSGILEPVKSRFATIISLMPNIDDWTRWAIDNEMPPELIAFLRFRPDLLLKFEPTAEIVNQPSPRTWAKGAAQVLKLKLAKEVELAALTGAVGNAAAGELIGYLRVYRAMPNLDSIITNPEKAPIPADLAARYAVATGLATKANVNNFARILTYAERLADKNGAEFAVLLCRDCDRRDDQIQHTPAWTRMCADTEMGRLISGDED